MRLTVRRGFIGAALVLFSGCERHADNASTTVAPQQVVEKWTVRFDQQERFQEFAEMLLNGDRVLLLDEADATVTALSVQRGDSLWVRGKRGAGPGEFMAPNELVHGGVDRFGVADDQHGRLTVFSGNVDESATLQLEGQMNSFCRETSGATLAIKFGEMVLVRLRRNAVPEPIDTIRWPVPHYNEFIVLRQARFARSQEGRCVVWQPRGDYFFELRPPSTANREFRRYAEPYPAPKVDRSGARPRLLPSPSAAKDAAIFADSLFLLRGSMYTGPGALVDVYSLQSGQRVKSLLLPNADAFQIDVTSGLLVVHRSTENGSVISAYA